MNANYDRKIQKHDFKDLMIIFSICPFSIDIKKVTLRSYELLIWLFVCFVVIEILSCYSNLN